MAERKRRLRVLLDEADEDTIFASIAPLGVRLIEDPVDHHQALSKEFLRDKPSHVDRPYMYIWSEVVNPGLLEGAPRVENSGSGLIWWIRNVLRDDVLIGGGISVVWDSEAESMTEYVKAVFSRFRRFTSTTVELLDGTPVRGLRIGPTAARKAQEGVYDLRDESLAWLYYRVAEGDNS